MERRSLIGVVSLCHHRVSVHRIRRPAAGTHPFEGITLHSVEARAIQAGKPDVANCVVIERLGGASARFEITTSNMIEVRSAKRSLVEIVCESRANYWAAYATDFSCPCLFGYLGMQHASNWSASVVSVLFGLFVFSLIEYAVHRWLLHDLRGALFDLHDAHHNNPERTSAFLFPTSLLLLVPVWCLLTWGLHVQQASYFLMGLSGGYFCFDTLHHAEHALRINQMPFRWLKKRWAFHSVHHRIGQRNFGVTTSFWDYVFGTHQAQVKARQSRA